jgi:porphobilinogen synthase
VAETRLSVDDLVAPLFVREGIDEPQPIASLPGVVQHTRESLRKEVAELADLGVPAVMLFGVPARKDAEGSEAWNPDGIVQVALRDLAEEVGERLVLMADCCLDEYTDHGHCGVLTAAGDVDNDATIERARRGAERDDGRPGRRHPRRARLERPHRHCGARLLGQVRVRPLRPVPRRRRCADRGWR